VAAVGARFRAWVRVDEEGGVMREDPLAPMADYSEVYTPCTPPETPRPNGRQPEVDLLAGLRNGAWLDAQDFPPLRYHLPGIIPEGSSLLVGPPKIGKSWFVLALGLAAASGGWMLGQHVDARPVLYLALEDGHRRLQSRCRTLLDTDRIPQAFDYLVTIQPGAVVATIETWLARHPGADPLVILDTLGKVMPAAVIGESSYSRDYRVGTVLKRLRRAPRLGAAHEPPRPQGPVRGLRRPGVRYQRARR
jgi:hypothetical protein